MSTDKKSFMNQLDRLDKVIKERADILDKANCRNVINYNKKRQKNQHLSLNSAHFFIFLQINVN